MAYSDQLSEGDPVKAEDIFYVGMTNSANGIKGRLTQFIRASNGSANKHSGAVRLFSKYLDSVAYSPDGDGKRLFFNCVTFQCEVRKPHRTADDLRTMGDIEALEYHVIAYVREMCGREPELNSK